MFIPPPPSRLIGEESKSCIVRAAMVAVHPKNTSVCTPRITAMTIRVNPGFTRIPRAERPLAGSSEVHKAYRRLPYPAAQMTHTQIKKARANPYLASRPGAEAILSKPGHRGRLEQTRLRHSTATQTITPHPLIKFSSSVSKFRGRRCSC